MWCYTNQYIVIVIIFGNKDPSRPSSRVRVEAKDMFGYLWIINAERIVQKCRVKMLDSQRCAGIKARPLCHRQNQCLFSEQDWCCSCCSCCRCCCIDRHCCSCCCKLTSRAVPLIGQGKEHPADRAYRSVPGWRQHPWWRDRTHGLYFMSSLLCA